MKALAQMRLHRIISSAILCAALLGTPLLAHMLTFKGTIAGIEPKRLQLKTGEEKKGQTPEWFEITPKTKIMRAKTVVTFAEAKMTVGERAVVIVDHGPDGVMRASEIRLAPR